MQNAARERPREQSDRPDNEGWPHPRLTGQRPDVVRIGRPDDRTQRRRHHHGRRVDNISGTGPSAEHSGGLARHGADRVRQAAREPARKLDLATTVAPGLADDDRGYMDVPAFVEGELVSCPHPTVVAVQRDQRVRVVDEREHHATPALSWRYSLSAAANSARAAASSPGV